MAGVLGDIEGAIGGAYNWATSEPGKLAYQALHPYQSPQLTHPNAPSTGSPVSAPAPTNPYSIIYQAPPNLAGTVHPYNTAAAYSQAQSQARANVDPLYQGYIDQFNKQIAAEQAQANEQGQLSQAQIQSNLQNTLQQNQITGQRTGEDTSTALSNLANSQQNYKQTEGLSFDQAQRALTGQLGASGTATSGLGQGQVAESQQKEALGQQAQGQQYQTQRVAEQLFANRSFEDLARSSDVAQQQGGFQSQQAQLSLDQALTQLTSQQTQQTNYYNTLKGQAEQAATNSNYDIGLQNFISGLANKGVSSADIAATGGAYHTI